jgi:replicative DNA helicase
MVSEVDRRVLTERLHVWKGQLPRELISTPGGLARFAAQRDADTLVVDSLKDLASNLSDEDAGMSIHHAFQACIQASIEVLALHHSRKAQGRNKRPIEIDDVYGSTWITAGIGSIILLWGKAGDPIVELAHLKQPADTVGPLKLLHDNRRGHTTVYDDGNVLILVDAADGIVTVREIAIALFKTRDPAPNDIEKARRRLNAEVEAGTLVEHEMGAGKPVHYVRAAGGHAEDHAGSRNGVTPEGHAAPYVVEAP